MTVQTKTPFSDCSARAIYTSHLLEHLYFEVGRQLTRESFRVLAGAGISFDRRLLIFPEQTQDLSIDFIGITTIPTQPKGGTVRRP